MMLQLLHYFLQNAAFKTESFLYQPSWFKRYFCLWKKQTVLTTLDCDISMRLILKRSSPFLELTNDA